MWVVVLVADEDALGRPPHAMFFIVLFQTLQAGGDGGIFFGLRLFRAECVVAERKESDRCWLVGGEGFWNDGTAQGLIL